MVNFCSGNEDNLIFWLYDNSEKSVYPAKISFNILLIRVIVKTTLNVNKWIKKDECFRENGLFQFSIEVNDL